MLLRTLNSNTTPNETQFDARIRLSLKHVTTEYSCTGRVLVRGYARVLRARGSRRRRAERAPVPRAGVRIYGMGGAGVRQAYWVYIGIGWQNRQSGARVAGRATRVHTMKIEV
jgi:hypothetical protein